MQAPVLASGPNTLHKEGEQLIVQQYGRCIEILMKHISDFRVYHKTIGVDGAS